MTEHTLALPDGREVRWFDEKTFNTDESTTDTDCAVLWFHGTPNTGEPPAPLMRAAEHSSSIPDLRWIGVSRAGYPGSTRLPGRSVADSARDALAVADAAGIERFCVIGHSGGGPHALAVAALAPDRVKAALVGAGVAPYGIPGYFEGMSSSGIADLSAAAEGLEAREARLEEEWDPSSFTSADYEALEGEWGWFNGVVERATAEGPAGLVDDDLAYAKDWGIDLGDIVAPTLLLQGTEDRLVPLSHGLYLDDAIEPAQLREIPGAGHISVLHAAPAALEWLAVAY